MKNNSFSHSKIISNIPVHDSSRYFSCSAASLTLFQATENSHSVAAAGACPVTAGSCFHFPPSSVWETEPCQRAMPWAFCLPWNPARLRQRHWARKVQDTSLGNSSITRGWRNWRTKRASSAVALTREKCWKPRYRLEDNWNLDWLRGLGRICFCLFWAGRVVLGFF